MHVALLHCNLGEVPQPGTSSSLQTSSTAARLRRSTSIQPACAGPGPRQCSEPQSWHPASSLQAGYTCRVSLTSPQRFCAAEAFGWDLQAAIRAVHRRWMMQQRRAGRRQLRQDIELLAAKLAGASSDVILSHHACRDLTLQ